MFFIISDSQLTVGSFPNSNSEPEQLLINKELYLS